jgi:hypothetical protein
MREAVSTPGKQEGRDEHALFWSEQNDCTQCRAWGRPVAGQRGAVRLRGRGVHTCNANPAPFFHVGSRVLLAIREARSCKDIDPRGSVGSGAEWEAVSVRMR